MAPIKDGYYWVKIQDCENFEPAKFWDEDFIEVIGVDITFSKEDIEEWGPELIAPK